MSISDVGIHQIGKKQMAIVFNKHALQSLQHGGVAGCQLTMRGQRIKIIFMRDTAYKERMVEFQKKIAKENKSFWTKVKGWFTWRRK